MNSGLILSFQDYTYFKALAPEVLGYLDLSIIYFTFANVSKITLLKLRHMFKELRRAKKVDVSSH